MKEVTVTLTEGQIALIGLIFGREYNDMRHGECMEETIKGSIVKLGVMDEVLKALGIDDGGDLLELAESFREDAEREEAESL